LLREFSEMEKGEGEDQVAKYIGSRFRREQIPTSPPMAFWFS
jgi:hypothetical protein